MMFRPLNPEVVDNLLGRVSFEINNRPNLMAKFFWGKSGPFNEDTNHKLWALGSCTQEIQVSRAKTLKIN